MVFNRGKVHNDFQLGRTGSQWLSRNEMFTIAFDIGHVHIGFQERRGAQWL